MDPVDCANCISTVTTVTVLLQSLVVLLQSRKSFIVSGSEPLGGDARHGHGCGQDGHRPHLHPLHDGLQPFGQNPVLQVCLENSFRFYDAVCVI